MFEKLLAEIRSGGTFEINALATRLEITPALVKAMLGHLQLRGYIHAYQTCGENCSGCYFQRERRSICVANPEKKDPTFYIMVQTTSDGGE